MPYTSLQITNLSKSNTVCHFARRADGFFARLRGLLGSRGLAEGCGLLLVPSSGVHTFGMRFAIDIVALDRESRVLGVWNRVGPGRMRALSRRTHAVLELPGGAAEVAGLAPGDQLHMTPTGEQDR